MKKLIAIFLLVTSLSSFSQDVTPTDFTGSKDELRSFFNSLWGDFKSFDNFHCYRRAHVLSHQMDSKNVNSAKVFFFNGDNLEMPHNWYYHVAPMVTYKGEAVVLDKGLFEGATYLKDWLYSFGEGHECRQITSMDEYREFKKSEACMYLITSKYYYGPNDLEEMNKSEYNSSDLQDMLFSLTNRQRKKYLSRYPITDKR